ncbi:hypothetical protein [Stenotrophomonas sp. TWI1183]|uniref:hypothetical protein n=1 Tax=Stenotrophomonas sp. TWI1183 TaxID=3136799 RepID=UPI0032090DF0
MQVDTFGAYVRAEREHWGREYVLHREGDYLGHQSKNVLQVLIEHKEDMPGRAQGYKPLESDSRAHMIEDIVSSMARDHAVMACCLRAYHCGLGRRKVERYERANMLVARYSLGPVSARQYLSMVELGFQRIGGRLEGFAQVA